MAALLTSSLAMARRHDSDGDDFPNYNKIEYAKPLPPVDQQVPEAKPGSFHMRVGERKQAQEASMDDIPMQLMGTKKTAEESEPSLDFVSADTPAAALPAAAPLSSPTVTPSTSTAK